MRFVSRISLSVLIVIVFSSVFSLCAFGVQSAKPTLAFSPGFSGFSTNLRYGDDSADVQQLQIFLNESPATQVAANGPGSSGQETTFFGQATLQAVIKFQNEYASQILTPVGLTAGTGYVGPSTRAVLNQLVLEGGAYQPSRTATPVTSASPSNSAPISSQLPSTSFSSSQTASATLRQLIPGFYLFQASPVQIEPGSVATLTGVGFMATDTVMIGSSISIAATSTDGFHIPIVIPTTTSYGKYEVWVTDQNGSSRRSNIPIYITITNNPEPTPTITSISPQDVTSLTEPITITGSGFTASNQIYSSLGATAPLASSGGTTLTFTLSQLSGISKLSVIQQSMTTLKLINQNLTLSFGVANEAGATNQVPLTVSN